MKKLNNDYDDFLGLCDMLGITYCYQNKQHSLSYPDNGDYFAMNGESVVYFDFDKKDSTDLKKVLEAMFIVIDEEYNLTGIN